MSPGDAEREDLLASMRYRVALRPHGSRAHSGLVTGGCSTPLDPRYHAQCAAGGRTLCPTVIDDVSGVGSFGVE